MRYHVPDKGVFRVLKCTAVEGSCKYTKHFDSIEEAWDTFELENEENLFPTKGIVDNDMFDSWDRTLTEEEESEFWNPEGKEMLSIQEADIMRNLQELEAEIERHQELQRGGAKTYNLWSFSEPLYASHFMNPKLLQEAWTNSDYDKVRLLYAIAMSREQDTENPGSIRMSPQELVQTSLENYRSGYVL